MAGRAGGRFGLVSYGEPVGYAREYFSEGLKGGDVVEEAGYPEDPDPTARVVRDGRVIATVERSSMEGSATYCDGQI